MDLKLTLTKEIISRKIVASRDEMKHCRCINVFIFFFLKKEKNKNGNLTELNQTNIHILYILSHLLIFRFCVKP